MTSHMPIMVDLHNKDVVLIGGGKVAARRINVVVRYTHNITVISPEVHDDIRALIEQGTIHWQARRYRGNDVQNADFIIIATDNSELNDSISRESSSSALVNVASNAEAGNATFPSIIHRGKLTLSVSTNGASPQLTKQIKNELETKYDESYESYIDFLNQCRIKVKHTSLSTSEKQSLLKSLLSEDYFSNTQQQEMLHYLDRLI